MTDAFFVFITITLERLGILIAVKMTLIVVSFAFVESLMVMGVV